MRGTERSAKTLVGDRAAFGKFLKQKITMKDMQQMSLTRTLCQSLLKLMLLQKRRPIGF